MDPSNDPHHPHPFNAFPNPFPVNHHPFYSNPAVNSSSAVAPPHNNNNNQFFQPPPQLPHPIWVHPPYSEMICSAIGALNEEDGSSKQAIARYIERTYTGIPPAHGALLTHHLKSLKNSGALVMVKKSYKLASAAAPPMSSVALAAPGFEIPRSEFTSNSSVNEMQPLADLAPIPSPQTQKRGRGRPPKVKPDSQSNGKQNWEQKVSPFSPPEEQIQIQPLPPPQQQLLAPQPQSVAKRPPGRPRKDGALPIVKTPVSSGGGVETAKRRGRPPSGRAAGRERKPAVVSAPASVFPYIANGGVRRRGRPKRVDTASASSLALPPPPPPVNAESGGAHVVKRGRGRPPKIGGVVRKPMKPKRSYIRTGKPLGRPRKNAASKGASRQQDIGYGELKKKFELFQEKAKEIVTVLKVEVGGSENQAVVRAIHALEELTVTTTEEPLHMEEVQPGQQYPGNEHEPEGYGQGQVQTHAEAMQEALF